MSPPRNIYKLSVPNCRLTYNVKQIVCDFFMMGTHTQGNGYFCHTYKVEKKQWDKQYCPAKNNATNGGQIAKHHKQQSKYYMGTFPLNLCYM